ncbi:MAG: GDP-L-fucose synthase [Candidatus Binatia bacterium]
MEASDTVCVAGARTLVGRALLRRLAREGWTDVAGVADEPDWTDAGAVDALFARTRPAWVFVAAGRSGGIRANQKYPADLMQENLLATCHVLAAAHRHGVRKLLYLASSCSYPRDAEQPMRVESLAAGPPEPSNAAYATAKRAGIQLCQAYRAQHGAGFIAGIPADVFGPGDDFDPEDSHVVPALIRKLHDARERGTRVVELWGSGMPRREFLFADDLADACLAVMRRYDGAGPINLGGGTVLAIRELAREVAAVVGYTGALRFDASRPDGMPVKTLDASALFALGWRAATPIRAALAETHRWYLAHGGTKNAERAA